jgi:hypothetical protein
VGSAAQPSYERLVQMLLEISGGFFFSFVNRGLYLYSYSQPTRSRLTNVLAIPLPQLPRVNLERC